MDFDRVEFKNDCKMRAWQLHYNTDPLLQTNAEFLLEYELRTAHINKSALTGYQEAPYGYDSVWTLALILNSSVQRMADEGIACFSIVTCM